MIKSPTTCPHCGDFVSGSFDIHEILVHPTERAKIYPPEYVQWRQEQAQMLAKTKKKKN